MRGRDGSVELHVVYNVLWARALDEELTPGDDVAEAAWFGAPDIRARRREVHEDTWHLIEHAGLADALEPLLTHPESTDPMGRNARARVVDTFDTDRNFERLMALFAGTPAEGRTPDTGPARR